MELPKVKVIFINDSCHSGSQYKLAGLSIDENSPLYRKVRAVSNEYIPVKNKYFDLVQLEKVFGKPKSKEQKFDLISISGCQDWETSADAYIGGKYQGAMTYALLTSLGKKRNASPDELSKSMATTLKSRGFEQNPLVTVVGNQDLLHQPLF